MSSNYHYRQEIDDLETKNRNLTCELREINEDFASISQRINVDHTMFSDLCKMMIESDDSVVKDIFEQMVFAGKLLFGEKLGELEKQRQKENEAHQQVLIQRQKEQEKRKRIRKIGNEQNEKRKIELVDCKQKSKEIKKQRQVLLYDFTVITTKYKNIDIMLKKEVDILLESGHVKITIFGNVKTISTVDIPTTKELQKLEDNLQEKITKYKDVFRSNLWYLL